MRQPEPTAGVQAFTTALDIVEAATPEQVRVTAECHANTTTKQAGKCDTCDFFKVCCALDVAVAVRDKTYQRASLELSKAVRSVFTADHPDLEAQVGDYHLDERCAQ